MREAISAHRFGEAPAGRRPIEACYQGELKLSPRQQEKGHRDVPAGWVGMADVKELHSGS